jgi:hypothetical protein
MTESPNTESSTTESPAAESPTSESPPAERPSPASRRNHPVLQVDDKYFGNLWADYKDDEDGNAGDRTVQYVTLDPWESITDTTDLFDRGPWDIAGDIWELIGQMQTVEAKLVELTGIPAFDPGPPPEEDSDEESEVGLETTYKKEEDKRRNEDKRVMAAAIEHRRGWVLKAIGPSVPRSPFAKLPAELINIIVEYCCDPLHDELEVGMWRMRHQDWDECEEYRVKDLVWDAASLAEFLFDLWKLLREAMVKKYEATEETKEEWEKLRQAGKRPY